MVVTGAARGLGLALARAFADRGAVVWLLDIDAEALSGALRELPGAHAATVDVTDAPAVERALDAVVAIHGHLDVLVNNAAIDLTAEVADLTLDRWRAVLEVNLHGVVHGIHHAYRHMVRQRHGLIVNVASGAGLLGYPTSIPYTTSKAALVGLTRALRAEAEPHGVRVALVFPGMMRTGIQASPGIGIDRGAFLDRLPTSWIDADRSARRIVDGLQRGRAEITTQVVNQIGAWLYALIPGFAMAVRRRVVRLFRALAGRPEDPGSG